ncbi:MAG: YcaQ family DNA glycosylase [Candidatus Obscuribacterales bacterium]|nr:YcaQ family DNA glycosylase [Steroidobacteraceae bacterium]
MSSAPVVTAVEARALLLAGQGLLANPARRAGPRAVQRIVEQLGFVQVDSIQKLERAHHLIIGARLDGYRAQHLDELLFRKRTLFEHWTHDAALIPTSSFANWKPRFIRSEERFRRSRWFQHRLGGDAERMIALVHDRITREGPLRTSDFERSAAQPATGWWDWTPEKAALEFLWHTGRLAIAGRDRFQKIYDLVERVFPDAQGAIAPTSALHLDWACRAALERLGVATAGELTAYWAAVKPADAQAWCRAALIAGDIVEVLIDALGEGKPRKAYAFVDWSKRVRKLTGAPERMRLLAPFDPVVRDRKRALRLFNFDYRFEAFVPAKQRKYGYYVCPLLEGDQLVGRIEPRHDRERSTLVIEGLWWERGIKRDATRKRKLNDALAVLAAQIGAAKISWRRSK